MTDSSKINEEYTLIDSKELRKKIIQQIIYPAYLSEIKNSVIWKEKWSRLASICFTLTTIIMSLSSIISFSVPQFPDYVFLAYIGGCIGVLALVMERFAQFCVSQNSINTKKINILIKSIGINDEIPDLSTFEIDAIQKIEK